jgi:hypothetical protein
MTGGAARAERARAADRRGRAGRAWAWAADRRGPATGRRGAGGGGGGRLWAVRFQADGQD